MNMDKRGILFVISGPSGVGKGTLRDILLQRMPDLSLSVSATTRQARQGEVEGVDYYFTSSDNFQIMIENEELLEYAYVYENMYGTPKKYVMDRLDNKQDVLLEIDIQGAMQVQKRMSEAVFIFIQPPSMKELIKRITLRDKDSSESIKKRLASYDEEMAYVKYYDYTVINDQVDEAVKKLESIIIAECCKVKNIK